eukprot:TRINITY_DN2551_c0_g1_i9.p1 TRINITY_DN2551_c0_g1~~TRINITY_DN2551_c0_g1_i9.p1  ORF type:complete len:218 (+),score=36.57 TRINITY_DN2551_c0_g1_i9:537-1190(+)
MCSWCPFVCGPWVFFRKNRGIPFYCFALLFPSSFISPPSSLLWSSLISLHFCLGCVLGALCMWAMGVFQEEPWHSFLLSYTTIKVNNGFGVNLIRGVGCNFLVCVGTVFAVLSESLSGKMMGVWLPVFTFVVSGYEHSIANMFFMTVATFYGAPFSYGKFVWQNLIPVTIGNIVGGGLFLAVVSWYCWYREEFEHRSKKVLQHAAVTPIDTSFSFKM